MKTTSILRILALSLIAMVAFILMFGEESSITALVIDKAIAFALFAADYRLLRHWAATDDLVRNITDLARDED